MRTTLLTWKYTLPAFLVPFAFTLAPEGLGLLLRAPLVDVVRASLTAALGVAALAVAFGGWIRGPASGPERTAASIAGLLLVLPNAAADLVGLAIFPAVVLVHLARTRDARSALPSGDR
jgi:TRAP-type uncharacterized transport system fused permease subunit